MSRTDGITPVVAALDDEPGVHIDDPIEAAQFKLFTSDPVSPTPVDPTDFFFPVEEAVSVNTAELVVPKLLTLHLRSTDGEFLSTYDPSEGATVVESGPRIVQIATAPMTLYVETTTGMTIRRRDGRVVISFGEPTPVRIGVRSFHESPAATIQVPDDPGAVMTALSYFGSALQTLSPERSFGTLRGHPPALEFGPSLDVPDALDRPDSPVTLELPPEWQYVYPAAPLAFYLGASVEPGPEPRLRCGGLERSLDGPDGYQAAVQDLFQHVFFMDCVTRTEGFYRVELHERDELERLPGESIDFAGLYDAPLGERLRRYLDLPVDRIESVRPTWHLCTDVAPEAEYVESLPAIVNELPLIRCPYTETAPRNARNSAAADDEESLASPAVRAEIEAFVRRPEDGTVAATADPPLPEDVFRPPDAPTIEHEWLGPGIPLGANKATPQTYRRRQDRAPVDQDHISIDVVCNDPSMGEEGIVEEYYGLRDLITFDVTAHYDLSRDELAGVLRRSTDLVHYIGHVDEDGFRCRDGPLDARTLGDVGCRAFLLNACTSYNQGQALIDAGSDGGVVTLSEVSNSVATQTGRTVARLLNAGFTLRSALSITHDTHATGQQYLVVGDGGLQLVQSESGVPHKIELRPIPDSEMDFEYDDYTYPSTTFGPGTFTTPNVDDIETNYLAFGYTDTFRLSADDLAEVFALERMPVEVGGQLTWSDELDLEDLGSVRGVSVVSSDRPGFR